MADSGNPGQFGKRSDTKEQASRGGKASTGKFGSEHGADPSKAGKKGNKNQPHEAKVEGGRHSHRSSDSE